MLTAKGCGHDDLTQFCGTAQHRRSLSEGLSFGTCDLPDFTAGAKQVNAACCDVGPRKSCQAGLPTECDARCGVVYVDFFSRCSHMLQMYAPTHIKVYRQLRDTCTQQLPIGPLLNMIESCSKPVPFSAAGGSATFSTDNTDICPVTDSGKCVTSRNFAQPANGETYSGDESCTISVNNLEGTLYLILRSHFSFVFVSNPVNTNFAELGTSTISHAISAVAFETESDADHIDINGIAYSGTTGPKNVAFTSDNPPSITWTTDSSAEASGWKICFGGPCELPQL